MRVPERLEPLVDSGIVTEVIRPLMAGKEAQIYLVEAGGIRCVAKVYKEAEHRSFKHRADYTEGRKVRNTREQRAMDKGTSYGKSKEEDAWRTAEVDAIYRMVEAGVRVPEPYEFVDGVLLMELITDAEGNPAPRLADVTLTEEEALWVFDFLLRECVKMLCAGIIHGDLSDFNVLMGPDSPVIIDFPQASDPARNMNARKLLVRDVDNLTSFLAKFAPELKDMQFGEEMWDLYEAGTLVPGTALTGHTKKKKKEANVSALLREIEDVEREARERREALGLEARPARTPVVREDIGRPPQPVGKGGKGGKGGGQPQQGRGQGGQQGRGQGGREDRPRGGDERGRDDRPRGGFDDRPREDRPRGGFDDRPREDRPRGGFDDRGGRGADNGRGAREDRPRGGSDDRPREDRPRGGFDDRGGRGADNGRGAREDRPRGGSDDRPRGGFDDRGRGGDNDRDDRPRGGFDDRGGRDDRPRPQTPRRDDLPRRDDPPQRAASTSDDLDDFLSFDD